VLVTKNIQAPWSNRWCQI